MPAGALESAERQRSVRKSKGRESVLGTFVLDSPSKVLFSSVLMAKLWRQPLRHQAIVRESSGFLCIWPEAGGSRLWRGEESEVERRAALKGVTCTAWARMPRQAGDCAEKSGRAPKKIRRPIGFARWSLWRRVPGGEWVCPGYICSGLSLQSSFLLVLGAHRGVSRFGAQKSQSSNSAVIRQALMRLCSARRRSRFLSISPDFMSSSLLSRHFLSPLPAFLRL